MAQMMNIEWRYSKAVFDPNQWHEISEARVDWLFKTPFGNNLHSLDDAGSTLEIKGLRPQVWQMLPVDGVTGRYVMRSNYTGPEMQVGTCYKEDERDSSKTGICLVPSTGEDNQKWDIEFVETTGTTYIFRNVANSSDYVLDCHVGNPIFMNKNFSPVNSPAQHWILRPDREINDDSYSTTYTSLPAGVTNKPLPTDGGSNSSSPPRGTTRGDSPAQSTGGSDSSDSNSSSLSAGAVAGIGIGAALGVLLLAALAFALLHRHRKQKASGTPFFGGSTPHNIKAQEMDGTPGVNASPAGWKGNFEKSPESSRSVPTSNPNGPPPPNVNAAYMMGAYAPQPHQPHQPAYQYPVQQYQPTPLHPGTLQSPSVYDVHYHGATPMTGALSHTGTWSSSGGKDGGTIDMMSPLGGYQPQQPQPRFRPVHEAMDTGISSSELDSRPM